MQPTKPTVTLNAEQALYVIDSGSGITCWGFQNCWVEIQELVAILGPDAPPLPLDRDQLFGTLEAYEINMRLRQLYAASPHANNTWFEPGTLEPVRKALEKARKIEDKVRIWYGDIKTGKASLEEACTVGRVGRTMGPMKSPILIPLGHAGGPIISSSRVLRIRNEDTGRDLCCHPHFHVPELRIRYNADFKATMNYDVTEEERSTGAKTIHSSHKTYAEAAGLIAWHHGVAFKPQD